MNQNIKNIAYENRVIEEFKLIIPEGEHKGEYTIEEPDGWADVNSILDIDDEFFNVNNFIIGETHRIKFLQYNDKTAYNVVKGVYDEFGGDGKIIFKWIINGEDILGDSFEINLNKYTEGYEMSMQYIEVEIKKREAESLLLNREDVSINLLEKKSVDDQTITPVETIEVKFKENSRERKNFYFYSTNQMFYRSMIGNNRKNEFMFIFSRGDDHDLGINKNKNSGFSWVIEIGKWKGTNGPPDIKFVYSHIGHALYTDIGIENIEIEISNFDFEAWSDDLDITFQLFAKIENHIEKSVRYVLLKNGVIGVNEQGAKVSKLYEKNESYNIEGGLNKGDTLDIVFKTDVPAIFIPKNDRASFEIKAKYPTPLRKTQMVRAIDALNQVAKSYTNGKMEVSSSLFSQGGEFYDTAISTGVYLRGLSYLFTGKITTSLKSLLYDGLAPLFGVGFDVQDNKLIVEDLDWFFKDAICYDLSDKEYNEEDYKISNDVEMSYNQLIFGGKKFSTSKKLDLLNFNTKLEASTPILSRKKKLDKQTECIIDEDKIQELILDSSSSTSNNDDDLVLLDLVYKTEYEDYSIFNNVIHRNNNGILEIISNETPFDTIPIENGGILHIVEGINIGEWEILEINRNRIKLNKQSNIQEDTRDTVIKFKVSNIYKNRTNEGFLEVKNVKDKETITNLRHNPKIQLARWFGYYGSGFSKKKGEEKIKITNYKNNGGVEFSMDTTFSNYDILGKHILNEDMNLSILRKYKKPYFNGENIEITLRNVSFREFFTIYKEWRNGDNARGYININTPSGNKGIYLFGDKALEHNMRTNELTIRGKIKNT